MSFRVQVTWDGGHNGTHTFRSIMEAVHIASGWQAMGSSKRVSIYLVQEKTELLLHEWTKGSETTIE